MSINTKQIIANASTPTFLITVPPGVCSVLVGNGGNAGVIFGATQNPSELSGTNGYFIPPNSSVRFDCYVKSRGGDLYAIVASGGTTQPVSALVSTTD